MVGIDPNNVVSRWLNVKMRAWRTRFHATNTSSEALSDAESVIVDARREPPADIRHAIQDKLGAVAALRVDAESRHAAEEVEEFDEEARALAELLQRLDAR
jgi:hypothetical protein